MIYLLTQEYKCMNIPKQKMIIIQKYFFLILITIGIFIDLYSFWSGYKEAQWCRHVCAFRFQVLLFHELCSSFFISIWHLAFGIWHNLNCNLYNSSANFVRIFRKITTFTISSVHLSPLQRPKHLQKNLATLAIKNSCHQKDFETSH